MTAIASTVPGAKTSSPARLPEGPIPHPPSVCVHRSWWWRPPVSEVICRGILSVRRRCTSSASSFAGPHRGSERSKHAAGARALWLGAAPVHSECRAPAPRDAWASVTALAVEDANYWSATTGPAFCAMRRRGHHVRRARFACTRGCQTAGRAAPLPCLRRGALPRAIRAHHALNTARDGSASAYALGRGAVAPSELAPRSCVAASASTRR